MPDDATAPQAPPAYLSSLNPEQREAVDHFEGPLLVLAGAGSGKTRVLTTRIAHLVHEYGVPPSRILAVTFTNKAADEMRERIAELLGEDPGGMWAGTFHSFGAWLMRRHGEDLGYSARFTIFDQDDAKKTVKRVMENMDIDVDVHSPEAVQHAISAAKNELIGPEGYGRRLPRDPKPFQRVVYAVYRAYQQELKRQDAMDFDDLLVNPVRLFKRDPELLDRYQDRFPFQLIDEYQDTNHAQYKLVEMLARKHRNLMVVGDDDQSIYGWRGADIRNILDFESDFEGCKTIRLEQNYRSSRTILKAANAVIEHNHNRKGKTLRTENDEGEAIRVVEHADDQDEARWIAEEIDRRLNADTDLDYSDFAVLYRTNAQSRTLENAMRRRGIPYQIFGGLRFYERREIKDVLAYLRLISNERDVAAFERCVNWPRRGIGKVTRERLAAWADREGMSLMDAAVMATECEEIPTRGGNALQEFAGLIDRFFSEAQHRPVAEIVEGMIDELSIYKELESEPDGEDRADNVRELVAAAAEFDAELEAAGTMPGEDDDLSVLDLFLQEVALVMDVDAHDPDVDAVHLMTLHSAKGLEYPNIFVVGMEQGLFPHSRSLAEPGALEEERRLCYVGLTRAEEHLYLSLAGRRRRAGTYQDMRPSPFLEEIPPGLTERVRPSGRKRSFDSGGSWGRGGSRRSNGGGRTFDWAQGAGGGAPDAGGPDYGEGDRVEHPHFGDGTVVRTLGQGARLQVVVDFDDTSVGRKKLAARYAGLDRVVDYGRGIGR